MAKAAVVVPVYKETLNEFEKISLTQLKRVLGNQQIIFVAPNGKIFPYFFDDSIVMHFPQEFFQSVTTYNALMLSSAFYLAFAEYEYILIYQLDAFVFSDELEYFCNLGYDYIGAAWPRVWAVENLKVGNGGFSLRKVKSCYKLLSERSYEISFWIKNNNPEDVFWAYFGTDDNEFNIAPVNIANSFSMEFYPARCIKKNGMHLPFGCHSWHTKSPDFYVKLFAMYGYDLRPLRDLMSAIDISDLRIWLIRQCMTRLRRRIKNGENLLKCLQQNRFASIRVVRHEVSKSILLSLLKDNDKLSDEIYFYEESELERLMQELHPAELPHLLISNEFAIDETFVAVASKNNIPLTSFTMSYLNYCEKIFHNLGK